MMDTTFPSSEETASGQRFAGRAPASEVAAFKAWAAQAGQWGLQGPGRACVAEGFALLERAALSHVMKADQTLALAWEAMFIAWRDATENQETVAAAPSAATFEQFARDWLAAGASSKKGWPLGLANWPILAQIAVDDSGALNTQFAQNLLEGWARASVWPGAPEPLRAERPQSEQAHWAEWEAHSGPPDPAELDRALARDLPRAQRLFDAAGIGAFTAYSASWIMDNSQTTPVVIEQWIAKGLPWTAWRPRADMKENPEWMRKARQSGIELWGDALSQGRWHLMLWMLEREPVEAFGRGAFGVFPDRSLDAKPFSEPLRMGRAFECLRAQTSAFGAQLDPGEHPEGPWIDMGDKKPLWMTQQEAAAGASAETERENRPAAFARRDADEERQWPRVQARNPAALLIAHWPAMEVKASGEWGGEPATIFRVIQELARKGIRACSCAAEEDAMARRVLVRAGLEREGGLSHALRAWAQLDGKDAPKRAIERALAQNPGVFGQPTAVGGKEWGLRGLIRSGLWSDDPEFIADLMSHVASGRARQFTPDNTMPSLPFFGASVWEIWSDFLSEWFEQTGVERGMALLAEPLRGAARQGEEGRMLAQAQWSANLPSLAEQRAVSGLERVVFPLLAGHMTSSGPFLLRVMARAIAAPEVRLAAQRMNPESPERAAESVAIWERASRRSQKGPDSDFEAIDQRARKKALELIAPHVSKLLAAVARDSGSMHPADRVADWARCLGEPPAGREREWAHGLLNAAREAWPYDADPVAWALWASAMEPWSKLLTASERKELAQKAETWGLCQRPLPHQWVSAVEQILLSEAAAEDRGEALGSPARPRRL